MWLLCAALCAGLAAQGQESGPEVHGTLRGKYEYQTQQGEGRFQVRTARVSVSGSLLPRVDYKAEIDLCDEGDIKMLDAYTRLKPCTGMQFTIGQMRVPFTIDAHRSPDRQYFANRSFIAKQVGNVRDVGAMAACDLHAGFPIRLQAGLFNGSGLTGQKNYWTKGVNFSSKVQMFLPCHTDLEMSVQKISPDHRTIMMYDGGLTYHRGDFLCEAEYLYKHYAHHAYKDVHSVDAFANYDIHVLRKDSPIKKVSPLLRYDFMTDHCDGTEGQNGAFVTTDYQRHRVTGGLTLSLGTPFVSDIRINYEKYFYRHDGVPKVSEKDKVVVEFMTHF